MFELTPRRTAGHSESVAAVRELAGSFTQILSNLAGESGCQREFYAKLDKSCEELLRDIYPCLNPQGQCGASFLRNSYPSDACGLSEDAFLMIQTVEAVLTVVSPLMDNYKDKETSKAQGLLRIEHSLGLLKALKEVWLCKP